MNTLILRRAHLLDGPDKADVAIADGRIAAIGPSLAGEDASEIDLAGRLLLPGFVDSHIHLDKAFLWESPAIHGKTGRQFFEALREFKRQTSKTEIKTRMRRALALASRHGTTAIRAQIDVDHIIGLAGLEAALELRREWARSMDLQLVAFPQEGLLERPGLMELLRNALDMGADVVGGGPSFDSVPMADHLEAVFVLAREFDRDVDLHVDLNTPAARPAEKWEVAEVARLTESLGWEGRVTVAHLRGIGAMTEYQAKPLLRLMHDAGINTTVVPGAELHTARAWWDPPAREITQAMTNVEALVRAGIRVSYSTGHVCDPWNPFGKADMLQDAFLLAAAYNLGDTTIAGRPIVQLATIEPWVAMRLSGPPGVAVGRAADLVVLDATDAATAVRNQVARAYVFKAGALIAQEERVWRTAWEHAAAASVDPD